jgi:hypothetical protein
LPGAPSFRGLIAIGWVIERSSTALLSPPKNCHFDRSGARRRLLVGLKRQPRLPGFFVRDIEVWLRTGERQH